MVRVKKKTPKITRDPTTTIRAGDHHHQVSSSSSGAAIVTVVANNNNDSTWVLLRKLFQPGVYLAMALFLTRNLSAGISELSRDATTMVLSNIQNVSQQRSQSRASLINNNNNDLEPTNNDNNNNDERALRNDSVAVVDPTTNNDNARAIDDLVVVVEPTTDNDNEREHTSTPSSGNKRRRVRHDFVYLQRPGAYDHAPNNDTRLDAFNAVWVLDWVHLHVGTYQDYNVMMECTYIMEQIRMSQARRAVNVMLKKKRKKGNNTNHLNNDDDDIDPANITWKIIMYDQSDSGSATFSGGCVQKFISPAMGPKNVFFTTRFLVAGRNMHCFSLLEEQSSSGCDDFPGVETATIRRYAGFFYGWLPTDKLNRDFLDDMGGISKSHYAVRQDVADALFKLLSELHGNTHLLQRIPKIGLNNDYSSLLDVYDVDVIRTKDVAHFWDIKVGDIHSQLRNRVTETIQWLAKNTDIDAFGGIVSPIADEGRSSVADKYARALLEYKIMVVAQKDYWEDHYRLMEAMISGGMVMSDPMFHMPAGYVNGTNIVIYESMKDLKEKIQYYLQHSEERLAIARAGRKLAFEHHTNQARFERVLYGTYVEPQAWPNSMDESLVLPLLTEEQQALVGEEEEE